MCENMKRLQLTIALDQNFTEEELRKIAEAVGGAFELKDRTYILKTPEEGPPTAAFSFGEISKENLPSLLGVIKSDYWKEARKEISKILSKRRNDEEPIISFECAIEGVKASMKCRTDNHKIVESAFERLDLALESLWIITQKKNVPGQKPQLYLGFDDSKKIFRIDRAIVLGPEAGEYIFDEKAQKWSKVGQK